MCRKEREAAASVAYTGKRPGSIEAADALPSESEVWEDAWEQFHTRQNANARFYKEKRYIPLAFPVLRDRSRSWHILEVGCGCGSTVLPLLLDNPSIQATAVDISAAAVSTTAAISHKLGFEDRLETFVANITDPANPGVVRLTQAQPRGFDALLMIFTLSAVNPLARATNGNTSTSDMACALRTANLSLEMGGLLLIRDYGLYDMTQLRFPGAAMIGDNLYMRQEGTLAYFFTKDDLHRRLEASGFRKIELEYHCVHSHNRKKGTTLKRVFIHAIYEKVAHDSV